MFPLAQRGPCLTRKLQFCFNIDCGAVATPPARFQVLFGNEPITGGGRPCWPVLAIVNEGALSVSAGGAPSGVGAEPLDAGAHTRTPDAAAIELWLAHASLAASARAGGGGLGAGAAAPLLQDRASSLSVPPLSGANGAAGGAAFEDDEGCDDDNPRSDKSCADNPRSDDADVRSESGFPLPRVLSLPAWWASRAVTNASSLFTECLRACSPAFPEHRPEFTWLEPIRAEDEADGSLGKASCTNNLNSFCKDAVVSCSSLLITSLSARRCLRFVFSSFNI
mmetsp:Transcript_24777/g.53885  ORF Transcript_24777/g.53885 Transcript_24777/m.53885 type:complete len:280 (+) Transcript_24777:96-935(+)